MSFLKCIFCLIFFFVNSTFAKEVQYQVNSKIYVNGIVVSSPKVITMANHMATIVQKDDQGDKQRLQIIANEAKGPSGHIDGEISLWISAYTRSDNRPLEVSWVRQVKNGEEFKIIGQFANSRQEEQGTTIEIVGSVTRL